MIGAQILELDRIDSTNLYANRLLATKSPEEGFIISTTNQFRGRGQGDNSWASEPGKNLTFTIILYPGFLRADRQFALNQAISLGILDYLRSILNPVKEVESSDHRTKPVLSIKWPNDIYIDENKAGGMLIEHRIMGDSLDTSIIGIGLNFNQSVFTPDIPNPVSLKMILEHEFDLKRELMELCTFLNTRYEKLKTLEFQTLAKEYSGNLLGYDSWREYRVNEDSLKAKITGVNEVGQLTAEDITGKHYQFNHHEIKYILSTPPG